MNKDCSNCKNSGRPSYDWPCTVCGVSLLGNPPTKWEPSDEPKPTTNADRIRRMSDEELAVWINNGISSDPCDYCKHNILYCDGSLCKGKADTETILEWLQQPAEEVK